MRYDRSETTTPRFLLVGPYDPHCGEYTFLAPPLGVWRLAGVLEAAGLRAEVFDPNCCEGPVEDALDQVLASEPWDVVGVSTTGMTLRYDLALAYRARLNRPAALIVAGGMEATFKPERMFELGPFDLVVLGEGEQPLLELGARIRAAAPGESPSLEAIGGTARRAPNGEIQRHFQAAMKSDALRDAIRQTPYEKMPYPAYWRKLESAYRVAALPFKAEREARLAEIRSVRLITLNYCPMACTFCSSTNFLHAAQGGSVARLARLEADECVDMIERIVAAQPDVRTVIFQDDIFVFTADRRILPLCAAIVEAKTSGRIPADLQFISTNRIDAMTPERLAAMRQAGFRVLGFGVENFSRGVLKEFNKAQIHPHIEPMLSRALELGITPFLDLILTSPRCALADLAETVRQAYRWVLAGCEVGMYPYVIPFSGAVMANDPSLEPQTVYTRRRIAGTPVAWDQPVKILPLDDDVRHAILAIEKDFESWLVKLQPIATHLPSRVRSLLWIVCAIPVLRRVGEDTPEHVEALAQLLGRLPGLDDDSRLALEDFAQSTSAVHQRPSTAIALGADA